MFSLFDQIDRHGLRSWICFSGDPQQPLQLRQLFFGQIYKLNTKSLHGVMPDFTFQVQPIIVGQEYPKPDNLSPAHFTNRVEVATAFRQISNSRTVDCR
jgi:hypothetical protein